MATTSEPYFDPEAGTICVDVEGETEQDIFAAMAAAGEKFLAGIESGEYVTAPSCSAFECDRAGTVPFDLTIEDEDAGTSETDRTLLCEGHAAELITALAASQS